MAVLVAFEGIDGSGKTTQAALLADWVRSRNRGVVLTKEPTSGPWGSKIRNSKFTARLSPEEELVCFVNDRKEHVAQLINPALARGDVVIVDRYYYSSVAYQGARGIDPKKVLAMNRAFAPVPHRVFLLDLDPQEGLERVHHRGQGKDLFETVEELTKARAIFRELAQSEPHVRLIDARSEPARVHEQVCAELIDKV